MKPGRQQLVGPRRTTDDARKRSGRSDPQPVFSEQLHRGCLRALFADLIGKHDPGADGQFGKRAVKNAVASGLPLRIDNANVDTAREPSNR